MHPGACAIIRMEGEPIGWCGALHPKVLKAFDVRKPAFAFEFQLDRLLQREVPYVKEVSRFPSVRRDLAILLPDEITYDQLRSKVAASAGPYLEKVVVFDVYQGQNLKEGYKSLAIGLIFNNVSSTLKDEDVDPVIRNVVSTLEEHLGAQLRG
jgi:phenylalanyl-tRNA synthetase beta chain